MSGANVFCKNCAKNYFLPFFFLGFVSFLSVVSFVILIRCIVATTVANVVNGVVIMKPILVMLPIIPIIISNIARIIENVRFSFPIWKLLFIEAVIPLFSIKDTTIIYCRITIKYKPGIIKRMNPNAIIKKVKITSPQLLKK